MVAEGKSSSSQRVVVLVSGGMDSATVLAIAIAQGYECYALSFDYGQRHRVELVAAKKIAVAMGVAEHQITSLDIAWMGGSALTDEAIPVPTHEQTSGGQIPVTYVPARNTIFLSVALGWAEVLGASRIYIGVNAVDYSGYPDCRPEFLAQFQATANLGTRAGVEGQEIQIIAPLVDLTKKEIITRGMSLGVDYGLTLSCYNPDTEGRACGQCDSCGLRKLGFEQAGVDDPTRYQP